MLKVHDMCRNAIRGKKILELDTLGTYQCWEREIVGPSHFMEYIFSQWYFCWGIWLHEVCVHQGNVRQLRECFC